MRALLCLAAGLLLAGCGDHASVERKDGILQTRLPGDVTSGGGTSGEVMARNQADGAVQPGPAGTPGIPKGAGGNVGGAELGGTVPRQTNVAATTTAPGGASTGPAAAASAPAPAGSSAQPAASAVAPSAAASAR
jgi:hypothetical protein